MWRLLYPLRYFQLDNSEKSKIDWIATAALAAALALPFVLLPGAVFFKNGGFLDKMVILTSALTGFYVAALVAAATFGHPDLDKTITAGQIAIIARDDDGQKILRALTRREFVCTMFGYLAFLALILSVFSAGAIGIAESSIFNSDVWWFWYGRSFAIVVYAMMTAHLMVVTSLGLYYLMDRLWRKDRQITTKKTINEAA